MQRVKAGERHLERAMEQHRDNMRYYTGEEGGVCYGDEGEIVRINKTFIHTKGKQIGSSYHIPGLTAQPEDPGKAYMRTPTGEIGRAHV